MGFSKVLSLPSWCCIQKWSTMHGHQATPCRLPSLPDTVPREKLRVLVQYHAWSLGLPAQYRGFLVHWCSTQRDTGAVPGERLWVVTLAGRESSPHNSLLCNQQTFFYQIYSRIYQNKYKLCKYKNTDMIQ